MRPHSTGLLRPGEVWSRHDLLRSQLHFWVRLAVSVREVVRRRRLGLDSAAAFAADAVIFVSLASSTEWPAAPHAPPGRHEDASGTGVGSQLAAQVARRQACTLAGLIGVRSDLLEARPSVDPSQAALLDALQSRGTQGRPQYDLRGRSLSAASPAEGPRFPAQTIGAPFPQRRVAQQLEGCSYQFPRLPGIGRRGFPSPPRPSGVAQQRIEGIIRGDAFRHGRLAAGLSFRRHVSNPPASGTRGPGR